LQERTVSTEPQDELTPEEPQEEPSEPVGGESEATRETRKQKKREELLGWIVGLVLIAGGLLLIPIVKVQSEAGWTSNTMLVTYIGAGLIVAAVLGFALLLKTARTRYSVERHILEHRDVHEYVILWNRPRWILYLPTMTLSVVFGALTLLFNPENAPFWANPAMLGGIWVGVAIFNVLIEQLHLSIKVVLIIIPTVGAFLLLLHMVGHADDAIRLLRHLKVQVPPKLYFVTTLVLGTVILIGWLHGLFHYLAITPNVADMQRGLTETGRQIKNSDYDIDFDATDVVERWLFGFGRIIISFNDPNKPPIVYFVPHASHMDERIRQVRSVTAIDRSGEV
jgi:hypothetical protein